MYVLDSSVLIEIINAGEKAEKIHKIVGDDPLVTTSITLYEVLAGATNQKTCFIYEGLFQGMSVLHFDAVAAKYSSRIERGQYGTGKPVSKADLFIAGICAALNATLVTMDKDFTTIDGLKVRLVS
ncbi:MAG: type II toxin-antitoxin system VapC family toxin [Nanoarchaeota archaeon]